MTRSIIVQKLTIEFADPAADLIAACFTSPVGCPLAVTEKTTHDQMYRFASICSRKASEYSYSVVAIADSGAIVGALICYPYSDEPDFSGLEEGILTNTIELLEQVDQHIPQAILEQREKLAHQILIAVHPDFRGQGIAGRLLRENHRVLRESGYKHCITEATGPFSQRLFSRADYRVAHDLPYSQYRSPSTGAAFFRLTREDYRKNLPDTVGSGFDQCLAERELSCQLMVANL